MKIIIILVALAFLIGCVDEGVRVVQVEADTEPEISGPDVETSGQAESPAEAEQNETAPEEEQEEPDESVETGADLTITNFFLSTIYPEPYEEFEISFKIKNSGSEDIEDFEYSIKFMEGNDVAEIEYYGYRENLASGSSTGRITKAFSLDEGQYEAVLTLDPLNAYEEENEDNNVEEQSLSVQGTQASSGSTVYTNPGSSSNDDDSGSDNQDSGSDSTCQDTDGGVEYAVKGTCTDDLGNNVDDICLESNEIWEWYCADNRCQHETHTCYCQEGKCIE